MSIRRSSQILGSSGNTLRMRDRYRSDQITFLFTRGPLGWLPVISFVLAVGLFAMAVAYWGSLRGAGWAYALFWVALLIMVVPVASRLLAADSSRAERIGLLVALGLALYLVKVMHSPLAFTFADELVHFHNLNSLLREGDIFNQNSILPVTPLYPGLALVTAALSGMTGFSPYAAGIWVIGVSRLVIILALFLFYERLSSSARLAGIATVLYMANSNFLFWSAQYAYESFALPLATLILFLLVLRNVSYGGVDVRGIDIAYVLLLITVVISHHMTTYALVAFLVLIVFIELFLKRRSTHELATTGVYAALALLAAGFWLFFVSRLTIDYIVPVLRGAVSAGVNLLEGNESEVRGIFDSAGGFEVPLWEQILGVISILLIVVAIPIGLLELWKRYRHTPIAFALALAALIYIPIQGLRLIRSGWEIANRSAEFLFIGIAFVLALAMLSRWLARQEPWRIFIGTMFVSILIMGGVIVGWNRQLRLAQPYQVAVDSQSGVQEVITSQGVSVAQWSGTYLGSGNIIATDPSNARLLLVYGDQETLAGSKYGIRDFLLSPKIDRGEHEVVEVTDLDYVVLARQFSRWDDMMGLYFLRTIPENTDSMDEIPPLAAEKFDLHEAVSRILDSGDILIYDVEGLKNEPVQ